MSDHRRRGFLMTTGLAVAMMLLPQLALGAPTKPRAPNVIYILADDLGYGELGCYGQKKIETPSIDRLAAEGIRFTQHYSGSPVCAPSRCTLLTGMHTGHAYVRDNHEMGGWGPDEPEGQLHLPPGTPTLGRLLQERGYATCAIGKWGLGGPGSTGHPNRQGFDHWYGYLCQRVAHNYYPTHLWRNGTKHLLAGNTYFSAHQRITVPPPDESGFDRYRGEQYAPDLMIEEALGFIRKNRGAPFFLYYATPVPHAAIQVPEDSLRPYAGRWKDDPYLGQRGYLPHPSPRAGYAAMISRMDRDIGRIMTLLKELELDGDTIVMFASDNGPTFNGGTDSRFFDSAGPLRGLKCDLYDGGIRVPFIARWPGRIPASTTSDHVSAFWDVRPTIAEIVGARAPDDTDGISMLPTLLGEGKQREHPHLYWEYRSRGGGQAVRMGRWKGLRLRLARTDDAPVELYDLEGDIGEKDNVADENPDIVKRILELMKTSRTASEHFPLPR